MQYIDGRHGEGVKHAAQETLNADTGEIDRENPVHVLGRGVSHVRKAAKRPVAAWLDVHS